MKRITWLSDIHLNFLSPVQTEKLFSLVNKSKGDMIVLTGDIGEGPRLSWYLRQLEARFKRPIYFVLGNHDFYHSSFTDVRAAVSQYAAHSSFLKWMNEAGIVELAPHTGMIGHDGWADGRYGDYEHSDVMMNDYHSIRDFADLNKEDRLQLLHHLGDEAATYLREWLPKALDRYPKVTLLTHVPPFREACWHDGVNTDDNFLPHFACKAVGDVLVETMSQYPNHQLTVLCGHTHGQGDVQIRDNLRVLSAGADYGRVDVQQVFEIND
jgi:predicted phosphodiesterase